MQLLSVIFPIFKDTRESDIEKDECEHDEDISKSKGKVAHVLIFCMHDKNVYDYCYYYDTHFNIKIHIAIMCHYYMYHMILYTIHINCFTFR